jgi:hypothetical protein
LAAETRAGVLTCYGSAEYLEGLAASIRGQATELLNGIGEG